LIQWSLGGMPLIPLTGTNFVRQSVIWIHSNDGHKHNGAKS